MVDIKTLLPELKDLVVDLAEDLLGRATSDAKIDAGLREAFQQIEKGGRTAQAFEVWRDDYLDQVAVAWVLACIFVRFMEDNQLIDECWLAGEGIRRKLAEDTHELYFREHPHDTDREYFEHVFRDVGKIPAAKDLFAEGKTPLWAVAPSGDAAMNLLKFWREIDAEAGHLKRSFEVEHGDTRFLGDLYQELSEKAKDKYALLQTPVFVEEFILDRTLTPAIAEFGLERVRMIDPTCGSGHFLLGGFTRLFDLWSKREGNEIKAAQKALDGVWGVDINPFAVAIARFRLIVAALRACEIKRLKQAPGWHIHLASGDSLLFGSKPSFDGQRVGIAQQLSLFEIPAIYAVEDRKTLQEILSQGYHVVVGNPPYITVKDKAQNEAYRQLYNSCHRKFSLGVPFTQRFWELAVMDCEYQATAAGYVGMITTNSFMKREFGKKLIEEFFPKIDLTHVLDTSGAYIPGHGTPTVILFGRNRRPVGETVRAVLGIKGEPDVPADASHGLVWLSITSQIDTANSQDAFTSTADVPRTTFNSHPWSIGGGGAADLQEYLNSSFGSTLADATTVIGVFGMTNCDEVFMSNRQSFIRGGVEPELIRALLMGDEVREWIAESSTSSLFPYTDDETLLDVKANRGFYKWMWPSKTVLGNRATFGKGTYFSERLAWWKWHQVAVSRLKSPFTIVLPNIATHNHFVIDRERRLCNVTALIVKLADAATEDDHIELIGLLNSSVCCFWIKQRFQTKGSSGMGRGIYDERWEFFFQISGTGLGAFPLPDQRPLALAKEMDTLAQDIRVGLPSSSLRESVLNESQIAAMKDRSCQNRRRLVALQEELDWYCYHLYGLLTDDLRYSKDDLPELAVGQRAFEIVMARQMAKGELTSAWFERHGSTPLTEIPSDWPTDYRKLVTRRIKLIETNKEIALIEKPEYKRRWNTEPWEEQEQRALKNWLLDRLETSKYRKGTKDHPELTTTAQMADVASADAEFVQVAALYRGRSDFDVVALVSELVEAEAVPLLPILRYKPAGLRKREVWERTWDLQRKEDQLREELPTLRAAIEQQIRSQGDALGIAIEVIKAEIQKACENAEQQIDLFANSIEVPPKYTGADFLKTDYWRLRGKLDVPKERWVSYPHCSTESDPSLVVGWAGWNHLQQATALIAYYDARKREGWDAKRLTPLLAGLDQLLPWIHQWHPEIDPEFGETAGKSYQTLLAQDAHELGLTMDDIRNWQPPATTARRRTTRTK